MDTDRLREVKDDARREAAPLVVFDTAILLALAVLSRVHGWELLGVKAWWLWLIVALPLAALAVQLFIGIAGMQSPTARAVSRELLTAVGIANGLGVLALVGSLLSLGPATPPSGGQLLASAFAVLVTNVVTFALAFWQLDLGGPVKRAMADKRSAPDFQFPQDENPQLASPDWQPRLLDYAYLALTNATAFSPTDVMPLSRRAKALMGVESTVSLATLLIVAARAVNILK